MDQDLAETLELLERLIGFDTVSARSNLELVAFVRAWLEDRGIEARLDYDSTDTKASLLATIGPKEPAGVVLSGHTDVVPALGQAWSSDPFRATRRGDRIVGRGSADMKGFLAVALGIVPDLLREPPPRPLHLAFSYDEEVGCKGAPGLLDLMERTLPHLPVGCVVGEPTRMRVVDGHKGKAGFRCTVIGREAHSALTPLGVNAVGIAAELVCEILRMGEGFGRDGPFRDGFEPPHDTASVGRIEGGSQLNIVPGRCSFELEFRTLPGRDPIAHVRAVEAYARDRLLPAMRRTAPEADIVVEEILGYPGLDGGSDSAFGRLCLELSGTTTPAKVSFGSDGGHFARRGIPTLLCGPGDIAVAHKPDEHVTLDQLARCRAFLQRLAHARAV
jgi:acetylornithine deacetylase